MRIFKQQKDTYIKQGVKEKENKSSLNIEPNNKNFKQLNESLIKLLNKAYYLQNKTKKNYEQKKELNDIFLKGFYNMKKLEKIKLKIDIRRNNSAIMYNPNFYIFNEIVNKYKKRDGIVYTKDLYDKDIFQETPIVANNEEKIKNFFVYYYDKYAKKTNVIYVR